MFFRGFYKKMLHSCIKKAIKLSKQRETISHTTEQAESPPLRYAIVMVHSCIVLVLLVSSKH